MMQNHSDLVGRNPAQEFAQERIPGSRFFDVDKISDTSSSLPHMLPSATAFAAAADALGVSNSSTVILYDRAGIFSAPRVWWTFKAFGHDRCDGLALAWTCALTRHPVCTTLRWAQAASQPSSIDLVTLLHARD